MAVLCRYLNAIFSFSNLVQHTFLAKEDRYVRNLANYLCSPVHTVFISVECQLRTVNPNYG